VNEGGEQRRPDILGTTQRDAQRRERREVGHQSFWQSLGVLGMVGWPIALGSVGGAFAGFYLDQRWDTGVRFTLMLLTAGTGLGSFVAWKTVWQVKS